MSEQQNTAFIRFRVKGLSLGLGILVPGVKGSERLIPDGVRLSTINPLPKTPNPLILNPKP
jgi:hypothetical protein